MESDLNKKEKYKSFLTVLLIVVVLSLLHNGLKHCLFLLWERTKFSNRMASMAAMTVLSIALVAVSSKMQWKLNVFPRKFTAFYQIATIVLLTILIIMPSNYTGGWQAILVLIYTCVITPVFEELIFRGLIWTKLQAVFRSEWTVYIINTILFGLWHLGYADSVAFYVGGEIVHILIWKVITGICFGLVLGFVRKYAKNCYATMLLHGLMNALGK
jgi:membrane protease YdiL (CAAX protease family)